MPAEQTPLPELPARITSVFVRIAHGRRKGSTEWISTGCAFGLDGCREADCGCRCHTWFSDFDPRPAESDGEALG